MARIEFECVEQKMSDLTGYWKGGYDDSKNPYKASKLHDDDFNFISGINFVLSYLTDCFLDNLDDYMTDEDSKALDSFKKEIAKKAIEEFAQCGYSQVEEMITSFLDSEEYDADFQEEE